MTISWAPYEHPGSLIPKLVKKYYGDFNTLLDVGVGEGVVGWGVWETKIQIHTLDIFPPKRPVPNFTLGDALNAPKIYGEKKFDVVMACEIIEHLPIENGPAFLKALETVAKGFIILTTPHGFMEHDPILAPNEPWADNPYQKHLSGWCHKDFMALGYDIFFNAGEDEEGKGAQLVAYKVIQ